MPKTNANSPVGDRRLRNHPWFNVGLAVLTAVSVAVAGVTSGLVQNVALLAAGLFGALLLDWIVNREPEQAFHSLRTIGLVLAGILIGFFMAPRGRTAQPAMFPRDDGLIADFASGPGGPARTALGTQFSLFSDSVWNAESKVWYERVDDGPNGGGFLRIHYQLEPTSSIGPYVGVYTDFSTPPPIAYDLSPFRRLGLRLRSAPSTVSPLDVGLILYSTNVTNPDYAFPRWQVPRQDVRAEWTSLSADLSDFVRPPFVNFPMTLDPTRVYRLGVIVAAERAEPVHGHLDIDDLRFSK